MAFSKASIADVELFIRKKDSSTKFVQKSSLGVYLTIIH